MTKALGHFINGKWQEGSGTTFSSIDPATKSYLWSGKSASINDIDKAMESAHTAFLEWSQKSIDDRISFLNIFKAKLAENKESIALAISQEIGKPFWESLTEVQAMISKVDISIHAQNERCPTVASIQNNSSLHTRHKPHGILTVFGPYNFPGHLPNGHIVPALLAGNVVIFKPSEFAPLTAQEIVKLWEQSGLPKGVLTLLQGDVNTAIAIANHPGIHGLLFTGSWKTGSSLASEYIKYPNKILVLEMGGNNPLIVDDVEDIDTAAYLTLLSAYLTTGQRCTCARRLIVPAGTQGDRFIQRFLQMTDQISIGHHSLKPEPFMGPLISESTANRLMDVQHELVSHGAIALKSMRKLSPDSAFVTPALLDVTAIQQRKDEEYFGPLLQLIRVSTFEDAIAEANNTDYGLVAGLLSDNEEKYRQFYKNVRAGVINWNTQTTGASSHAPFGGIGKSGNFRPSAYYAADYCSYPVASMESVKLLKPTTILPGLDIQ